MSDLVLDCVFHKWGKVEEAWFPENLNDFIQWCTEKLNSIPEEYRASAKIRIRLGEHNEHGNFLSGSIAITYMRPRKGTKEVTPMMTVTDQIEAIELLKQARQIIEHECDNAEHKHNLFGEYADWERRWEMDALLKRIDALFSVANK